MMIKKMFGLLTVCWVVFSAVYGRVLGMEEPRDILTDFFKNQYEEILALKKSCITEAAVISKSIQKSISGLTHEK